MGTGNGVPPPPVGFNRRMSVLGAEAGGGEPQRLRQPVRPVRPASGTRCLLSEEVGGTTRSV